MAQKDLRKIMLMYINMFSHQMGHAVSAWFLVPQHSCKKELWGRWVCLNLDSASGQLHDHQQVTFLLWVTGSLLEESGEHTYLLVLLYGLNEIRHVRCLVQHLGNREHSSGQSVLQDFTPWWLFLFWGIGGQVGRVSPCGYPAFPKPLPVYPVCGYLPPWRDKEAHMLLQGTTSCLIPDILPHHILPILTSWHRGSTSRW